MAIIKRKIENLKPGKEYLVTVRSKNMDINTSAELAESIRFTVPEDDTQPSAITNLALYQSLQNVMFVFDFVNDADIARYEYELYNGNTTSSNLISTGFNDANVFTVSVENLYNNSGLGTGLIPFWGRVRAIDTSGNNGLWTSLAQTSGDAPLIDSQYIGSLTASKITAGTIGAQTIQLNGVNSILRSSGYTPGSAGWIIKGDGSAEFRSVTVGGSSSMAGISIGNNQIFIGTGTFGNANTGFYVDSAGQFSLKDKLTWDGTTLTVVGAVTATSGTFTGTVNANAGNFTGSITIGGNIKSGQTAYNTGTGFWLGVDGVTPKFSIGNSSGNLMSWDGSTLNIVGTITGTLTGSITSNAIITGGTIQTAASGNRIVMTGSTLSVISPTAGASIAFQTQTNLIAASITSTGGFRLQGNAVTVEIGYGQGPFGIDQGIRLGNGLEVNQSNGYVRTINSYAFNSEGAISATTTITSGGLMEVNGLGIQFTGANRIGTNNQMGLRWTAGFASVLGTIDNAADCVLGTVSDIRLKTDIRTLDDPVLPKLRELRPVKYYPLDLDGTVVDGAKELIGLIAQEVSHVYPHLVPGYDPDDLERYISVDYAKLTPLLIKAIRELEDKILEIESKI